MRNFKIRQIGGFLFAFTLVIGGIVLLTHGYENEWGWFFGFGFISFVITLIPQDFLDGL